jgi:hypothetical protein
MACRMPWCVARPCRFTRVGARQHKLTPHRLVMNNGRCLLVPSRRAVMSRRVV